MMVSISNNERICFKIKYFSIRDANYAKRHLKNTGIARKYKCKKCGKLGMGEVWHLTSNKGKVKP